MKKNTKRIIAFAIFASIIFGIWMFYEFFINVPFSPLNPIFGYVHTKAYRADNTGNWSTYTNKEQNISLNYPASWKLELGNYSDCFKGRAIWISNPHARAHIIICKEPYIEKDVSLPKSSPAIPSYFHGETVKKITTPYNTFYSLLSGIGNNLSITEYAVSEDKNMVLHVQIPYISDDGANVAYERDKVFLKILNSIKPIN